MRILITGATGFIGQELIKHLTEHQLTVLSRSAKQAHQKLHYAHFANINYIESLDHFNDFNHIDVIINLAGEPIAQKRWTEKQKESIAKSRWDLTAKLTELIAQSAQPPHTFISGSAIGYYGSQPEIDVDEETNVSSEDFTHQVCKKWEEIAQTAQSEQTRVCIIRTGIVLGSGGGALEKMLPPFKLGIAGRLGSGKQQMSWIHIQDMVQAICYLINTPTAQGIFNFCAPHPVSNQVFTQTLSHVLKRPAIIPVPEFVLKILMGESSCLVLDSLKAKPKHLTAIGFDFTFPHLTPALRQILRHH